MNPMMNPMNPMMNPIDESVDESENSDAIGSNVNNNANSTDRTKAALQNLDPGQIELVKLRIAAENDLNESIAYKTTRIRFDNHLIVALVSSTLL